jgi:hypothetical protein
LQIYTVFLAKPASTTNDNISDNNGIAMILLKKFQPKLISQPPKVTYGQRPSTTHE